MKISTVFVTALLLSISLFAQNSNFTKADRLVEKLRLEKAATFYKKIADADVNNITAKEKLARIFVSLGDNQSAEAIYKTLAENPIASPLNKLYYAQLLSRNGKYTEADAAYALFAAADTTDVRGMAFNNFEKNLEQISRTNLYELSLLPDNSPASDIGPAYNNGQLVFASNRAVSGGKTAADLWNRTGLYDLYEQRSAGAGEKVIPEKMKGKVSKRLNEGPATFSSNGKEMIFTRTNYKGKSASGLRKLGLYHADYDKDKKKWVNIQPLSFNDANYNMMQPSLSKDGKQLFFVSDMHDSISGADIYLSTKTGNKWSKPVSIGKEINTTGRELFPFISDDGTLYFASDSRLGFGGLDVFSADLVNGKWQNIRNLGAGANTNADDFGYVSDETDKNGFIVSNRSGGTGGDDIYKFKRLAETVCGSVVDAKTKKPIEHASITANLDSNIITATSNQNGDFCMYLLPEKVYKTEAQHEGYNDYKGIFVVKTNRNGRKVIEMQPRGGIDLIVDVTEKEKGSLEGATAFLVNKKTGEVIEQKSDNHGKIKFDLYKDQEYDLKVVKTQKDKKGIYDKFVKTISTMGFAPAQKINQPVQLTYYDDAAIFDLPNVYFEYGSTSLIPAAQADLDKVAQVMKSFPDIQVEISAHTDCRGSSEFNMQLSAERAGACVDYLAWKGVDIKHIIAIGYGEEKIRNKCVDYVPCTEEEHAINRRTEFKVVKFD